MGHAVGSTIGLVASESVLLVSQRVHGTVLVSCGKDTMGEMSKAERKVAKGVRRCSKLRVDTFVGIRRSWQCVLNEHHEGGHLFTLVPTDERPVDARRA